MGVIAPKGRRSRVYFGCGGTACLGLIFWLVVSCCLVTTVVGLSTEIQDGDAELVSAYYALSQIMVGSLAFCFSMVAILATFIGFGILRQTRQFVPRGESHSLNEVLLFFFLFIGGMILTAGLPTFAMEYPGTNGWFITIGIILGSAYLLFGLLMLWLTLTAYESYRHAEGGEIP